mgnify:FL=1
MLNENIKAIRKSKGLSQQELAVKLNIVRQTVPKWEQGLSVPDSAMLISLSEALETPVSTLLGETVMETGITVTRKPLFSEWQFTHLYGCLSEWRRLSLLVQSLEFF